MVLIVQWQREKQANSHIPIPCEKCHQKGSDVLREGVMERDCGEEAVREAAHGQLQPAGRVPWPIPVRAHNTVPKETWPNTLFIHSGAF